MWSIYWNEYRETFRRFKKMKKLVRRKQGQVPAHGPSLILYSQATLITSLQLKRV